MAARTARLITARLHEQYSAATSRVDRESGTIRGVKVLGFESPNRHGVKGAKGTVYLREAVQRAANLYEGVGVYKNHPDRKSPNADRDIRDRLGWLENVRLEKDGLYADLRLLMSDPDAQKVLEIAESNPRLIGLSHNALGRGEVRQGKYTITEIPEVRSVDIVADPATNKSLFESAPMKTTLREVIEALEAGKKKRFTRLLEDDGMAPALDMPMDAPPPADAPPEEAGDWKADLVAAIGKLVSGEDEADHKMAQKIMGMLKPGAGEPAPKAVEEEEEPDDGEKAEAKDDGDKKETKESRQRRARSLCELAGVNADVELLESLSEMSEDGVMKHIGWLKKHTTTTGRNGVAVRSSPAGSAHPARGTDKLPASPAELRQQFGGR